MSPEVQRRQEGMHYNNEVAPHILEGQRGNAERSSEIEAQLRRDLFYEELIAQGVTPERARAEPYVEVANLSSKLRGRKGMQAHIATVLNVQKVDGKKTSSLDNLPDFSEVIYPKERKRMREIQKRLQTTLGVVDLEGDNFRKVSRNFRQDSSYIYSQKIGNADDFTYTLARGLIGNDIRWLSDPSRINNPENPDRITVTPEREKIFLAYRKMLDNIKNRLVTPAVEHEYITKHGKDHGSKRLLRENCRDPGKLKNSSKFLVFLAVGALLALWAIKDIRKGKLSFGTLVLLGAAMFLAQSGPKNAFMSSQQFSNLSKDIGPKGMKSLQDFERLKPTAYSHLVSTLSKQQGSGGITKENLHLLTDPKTTNGRPILSRRVPKEIAEMFIGRQHSADDAYVMRHMRGLRDPQSRQVAIDLAKANKDSGGRARDELEELIRTPEAAAG
jgi:hypothetical protein